MDHHNDENWDKQCHKTVYATDYPAAQNRREFFKALKLAILVVLIGFVILVILCVIIMAYVE